MANQKRSIAKIGGQPPCNIRRTCCFAGRRGGKASPTAARWEQKEEEPPFAANWHPSWRAAAASCHRKEEEERSRWRPRACNVWRTRWFASRRGGFASPTAAQWQRKEKEAPSAANWHQRAAAASCHRKDEEAGSWWRTRAFSKKKPRPSFAYVAEDQNLAPPPMAKIHVAFAHACVKRLQEQPNTTMLRLISAWKLERCNAKQNHGSFHRDPVRWKSQGASGRATYF